MTQEPLVCTLSETAAANHALQWADLQRHATEVETVPSGARMVLPGDLESVIVDLARAEVACCAFLDIEVRAIGGNVVVEVTSRNPDALAVISLLTGVPRS